MTEQPQYRTVVAADDPELSNQIVNELLSGGAPAAPQAAAPVSPLNVTRSDIMPRDNIVKLPGGYINQQGELITEVEIVELNGFAEEALARPMGEGKRFNTILEHSVEKVGSMEPNHEILDRMLLGDRNAVLLGVRAATYGDVELEKLVCPSCSEFVNLAIDLTKDVPVKPLEDPTRRNFTVELSRGPAEVTLPDGYSQTEVLNAEGKSDAELTSIILKNTVNSVNGIPTAGMDSVRALSAKDRRKIMEALDERDFGPQLDKVAKPCPSCGKEIPLPLTLGSLF